MRRSRTTTRTRSARRAHGSIPARSATPRSTSTKASRRAPAARSSSRSSRRQPDRRVQGPRHLARHPRASWGRGGSGRSGRSSSPRPATSARGSPIAGRALGVPVVVFADEHANPSQARPDPARSAPRVIQERGDFDDARAARRRTPTETRRRAPRRRPEPGVAAGAARSPSRSPTPPTRGELPLPAEAYVPVGNGALIIGVGAWLRHAAPGLPGRRRPVGRGSRR